MRVLMKSMMEDAGHVCEAAVILAFQQIRKEPGDFMPGYSHILNTILEQHRALLAALKQTEEAVLEQEANLALPDFTGWPEWVVKVFHAWPKNGQRPAAEWWKSWMDYFNRCKWEGYNLIVPDWQGVEMIRNSIFNTALRTAEPNCNVYRDTVNVTVKQDDVLDDIELLKEKIRDQFKKMPNH